MMKQDIKFFIRQERQKYVSPSVKVIEVTAQRVLCGSGGPYNNPWADPERL